MGYICEFCGEQRSMVYCRSDAACLCLSCDRNVHSANALSRRHSRTLLCERCNSQPAVVRCAEERVSLCQNCDWIGHGASTSPSTHKRQTLNCYSGCPSAAELSSIWSFVLDFPSAGESTCEKGMGLMSIAEDGENAACVPPKDSSSQDISVCADVEAGKANVWVGSSSLPERRSVSQNMGQQAASASTATPKVCIPITKSPGLFEDDRFYEDFNMDEVDLDLENYEELFGVALTNSELLFENGGIESLFGTKEMSAADSNCQGPVVAGTPVHHVADDGGDGERRAPVEASRKPYHSPVMKSKYRDMSPDNRDSGHRSSEKIKENSSRKSEGVMKKERALAYAISYQQQQHMQPEPSGHEGLYAKEREQAQWGWNWLERWMAAQPYNVQQSGMPDHPYMALPTITNTTTATNDLSEKTVEMDMVTPENMNLGFVGRESGDASPTSARHQRQSSSNNVPSYMAPTQSAKAKVRGQGPGKQRSPLGRQWNPSTKKGQSPEWGCDSSSSGGGTTTYQAPRSPIVKVKGQHGQARRIGGFSPEHMGTDDWTLPAIGRTWRHDFD